MNVMHMAEKI